MGYNSVRRTGCDSRLITCLTWDLACPKDALVYQMESNNHPCNWIGDWCHWSWLNPLYRESVNRCYIRSLGVKSSAPTAHWVKTPATAHLGLRPVRPGFPLSPQPPTRSNRDSLTSLLTPVGAGKWHCPAGCPSPAVRRLLLSEFKLWQLRRRSMTPAAGSLDVCRLQSSTSAAARRLQSSTGGAAL